MNTITPLELAQLAAYIAQSEGIAANSDHVAIAVMLVEKSAAVIAGWRAEHSQVFPVSVSIGGGVAFQE